jgi:hypothetical protein
MRERIIHLRQTFLMEIIRINLKTAPAMLWEINLNSLQVQNQTIQIILKNPVVLRIIDSIHQVVVLEALPTCMVPMLQEAQLIEWEESQQLVVP